MSGPLPGGQALVDELEARRQADPADGASKARAFAFNNRIYGASAIKQRLSAAQHGKCCYCEGKFDAYSPGDVEHFRPKTCVQQLFGEPLSYPGYFWLAYHWENLLYACPHCNRSAKKSQFPIQDPAVRPSGPADPLAQENPMLINPLTENPAEHIRFADGRPIAVTTRGQTTIDVLKLDRGALRDARLGQIKRAEGLIVLIELAEDAGKIDLRDTWQAELDQLSAAQAPFSATVQAYLAAHH